MTRAEYDALDAVNWSTLRHLATSPAHYRHALATPRADTPALRLGRLTHLAVLQPDELPRVAVVADQEWWRDPSLNRATKEGKARWQAWLAEHPEDVGLSADDYKRAVFLAEHPGRELVEEWEYRRALAIRDAVRRHPVARSVLERTDGIAEIPVLWRDRASGIDCKAIPDWRGDWLLVELKTGRYAVDARAFAVEMYRRQYHGQLAYYRRGLPDVTHAQIIAVEPEPPHDVAVYQLDADTMAAGDDLVQSLLDRLAECRATDCWPGAAPAERVLSLPAWAYVEDEMEAMEVVDA